MAIKYGGGEEEKWEMESLYWFTNLIRACPKDPFPVPKIGQLVDVTYGHLSMSFLDAFQDYHQIALAPEDQEKTSFILLEGIFITWSCLLG